MALFVTATQLNILHFARHLLMTMPKLTAYKMNVAKKIVLVLAVFLVLWLVYHYWRFVPWVLKTSFVSAPERLQPSPNLLDDSALALRAEDIPKVPEDWRRYILAQHQPIRSLVSDDFSDLTFLEPLLRGKRVVQLGEYMHGVAEFNWLKVRLVKYLHQKLNYSVIVFESPMTACDAADRLVNIAAAETVLKDCLYGIWHSPEIVPLFEYAASVRKSIQPLSIAGFDIQDLSVEVGVRFKELLDASAPHLAEHVFEREATLIERFHKRRLSETDRKQLQFFYSQVAKDLTAQKVTLESKFPNPPYKVKMAIQEARSRIELLNQMSSDWLAASNFRDKAMADNLEFLLDTVYRDRKVIVWAANGHIAYESESDDGPDPMGSWLAKKRRQEIYSIGFYMGRGVTSMNNRKLIRWSLSDKDVLVSIMANAGRKMSFIDFANATRSSGSEWMFTPIIGRDWLMGGYSIIPQRMFDAAIYIDQVTPPRYLE